MRHFSGKGNVAAVARPFQSGDFHFMKAGRAGRRATPPRPRRLGHAVDLVSYFPKRFRVVILRTKTRLERNDFPMASI